MKNWINNKAVSVCECAYVRAPFDKQRVIGNVYGICNGGGLADCTCTCCKHDGEWSTIKKKKKEKNRKKGITSA